MAKQKNKEIVTDKSDTELLGLREEEKSLEEVEQELEELKAQKQAALPRCKHVNSHSRDIDNELDRLVCELTKGHSGNHAAPHIEWERPPIPLAYDQKGIPTPAFEGESHEVQAEWNDSAGADWPEYIPQTQREIETELAGVKLIE